MHHHPTAVLDLLIRFLLGGVIVSAFAAAGELFKPKTFSGLFSAAPSVAIASLALAFHQHGSEYASIEARSMIFGGLAMVIYCGTCVLATRQRRLPVWLEAGLAWLAWGGAVFLVVLAVRALGGWS